MYKPNRRRWCLLVVVVRRQIAGENRERKICPKKCWDGLGYDPSKIHRRVAEKCAKARSRLQDGANRMGVIRGRTTAQELRAISFGSRLVARVQVKVREVQDLDCFSRWRRCDCVGRLWLCEPLRQVQWNCGRPWAGIVYDMGADILSIAAVDVCERQNLR